MDAQVVTLAESIEQPKPRGVAEQPKARGSLVGVDRVIGSGDRHLHICEDIAVSADP